MENENEKPQKKNFFASLGTRHKVFITCLVVLLLIGFISCRSTGHIRHFDRNSFMRTGNVALAPKDFEPVGIIFAEASASRRDGYAATYNALVREAVEKGADAVINVNISSNKALFNRTWSGSALAIKYLERGVFY